MTKNLIRIFFVLFLFQSVQAQESILTGKVRVVVDTSGLFYTPPNFIDDDPYALPGAAVTLLELDSSIVMGAATSPKTGAFKMEEISPGEYLLKTFYVGYEVQYDRLIIGQNDSLFIQITLGNIYPTYELPFDESQASTDLNNGVVQFKIWGVYVGGPHPLENKKLQDKLGFNIVYVYEKYADDYPQQWEKFRQASIRYNKVVDEYLLEKYPKQWKGLDELW